MSKSRILAAGIALAGAGTVAFGQTPSILFTADTEGQVTACGTCPGTTGWGGLGRRAAAVAAVRAEAPDALLLDAGNALLGGESLGSRGQVMVAAYQTMRYDAVNVSFRDFRLGRDATVDALGEAGFPVLSANLADADTGELLFRPFVVREAGGERVAILGVTDTPAGLARLPHLQEQLAGVRIVPVAEAMARWLPEARDAAPRVILLYYGSAGGLREVRGRFGDLVDLILVGGVRPDFLPREGRPPVAGSHPRGTHLARVTWVEAEGDVRADVAHLPLSPEVGSDPAMADLLAEYASPRPPIRPPEARTPPAAARGPLVPGRPVRVGASLRNRGARMAVTSTVLDDRYGETVAAPGRRLLVLGTEWENVIPLTLVAEEELPTEYRIPVLGDHLYVVVNGTKLGRLHRRAETLPGHVPPRNLRLERIGERIRGNAVFEVPEGDLASVEVRFYDFSHGHMRAALVGEPPAAADPVAGPLENEIVEAAVFGVRREAAWGETRAPEGMVFVDVDLRARSRFVTDADATAFDPQARRGDRMAVGTVADWTEALRHVHLVADGEYGYRPDPERSDLPEAPRFLPDLMTGGRLVFLAPAEAASLELRAEFPNARLPDGRVIRAADLAFALHGERPDPPRRPALAEIDDDVFRVRVTGRRPEDRFAGLDAPPGRRFLVLRVEVENRGARTEIFQTREQVRHVAEDGRQTEAHPATFQGAFRPSERISVPPGQRRTFEVAFAVTAGETRPRLAYAGVSRAAVVDLADPDVAEPVEVAAVEPPPTAPPAAPSEPAPPAPPATPAPADPPPVAVAAEPPPDPDPEDPPRRVPAHPGHEPQGLAGVGLTPEQVNAAIDRGADFLWAHLQERFQFRGWMQPHGSGGAYGDLYALALLHAHLHDRDASFAKAIRQRLDLLDPAQVGWHRSYRMGVLAMLIEAYGDPAYLPRLEAIARWLVEAQGQRGFWAYDARVPDELMAWRPERPAAPLFITGGDPPGDRPPPEPWTRVTDWDVGADKDLSVAQFALLGLHAAERSGLRMPRDLWQRTLDAHVDAQMPDGGWGYTWRRTRSYGSMTCAGICAVALAGHALGHPEPARHETVERGLAWLAENFTVSMHPPDRFRVPVGGQWLYYYLYSLERVGRILDTEFIGEHEWYPLGARFLVDRQRPDGSWPPEGERPEALATAFALLFLTRATPSLAPEAADPERPGTLRMRLGEPPPERIYIILDASGSLLELLDDGRIRFDLLRDAVRTIVSRLPDSSQVALRVFGHRLRAIEPGADEDTALEVPMRALDREAFEAVLAGLRPRGKTPLALSLRETARDLARVRPGPDRPVKVVLLAEGEENTRPLQDPLAAARELARLDGIEFIAVGFEMAGRPEWSRQMEQIADTLGGRYATSDDPRNWVHDTLAYVLGTPESFDVTSADGEVVARGRFGETVSLPMGEYTLRTRFAGRAFAETFWIHPGRTTSAEFQAAPALQKPPSPPAAAAPPTEPPPARFCTGCGTRLAEAARFCTACGAAVP